MEGILNSAYAFAADRDVLSYLTFQVKPYWSTVILVTGSKHIALHNFQGEEIVRAITSLLNAATACANSSLRPEPDGIVHLKQPELQQFLNTCSQYLQNEF